MTTCNPRVFLDDRENTIIQAILDTGARAREFLALNLADVDLVSGAVTIRRGKGRKPRTVFLGEKARRALRALLKAIRDELPALWVTDDSAVGVEILSLRLR